LLLPGIASGAHCFVALHKYLTTFIHPAKMNPVMKIQKRKIYSTPTAAEVLNWIKQGLSQRSKSPSFKAVWQCLKALRSSKLMSPITSSAEVPSSFSRLKEIRGIPLLF
jgi:hypothetical protein